VPFRTLGKPSSAAGGGHNLGKLVF
jgi:hypothetical protein